MDWKLEVIVLPVTDVDRAKAFYTDRVGFRLDVDHSAGEDFRIVQLTPPGSACSVVLKRNPEAAGSVDGLQIVVNDLDRAHAELTDRGAGTSGLFHFEEGRQVDGPHPARGDFETFLSFSDPDGNSWMLQECPSRLT